MARRTAPQLPVDLEESIERAGYLPAVVREVLTLALGADEVVSHLLHQETTFDEEAVRRHLTVLALTERRLVIAHADDHQGPEAGQHMATATTETVPLSAVRGVMMTHVLPDPAEFDGGDRGRAVTLTLGWGTVSRLDLIPAACSDPTCEGDHGYEGTVASDDISLRITADADGPDLLHQALEFAQQLSLRIGS